ncbi:MAG: energy coupling factor transporter S component ThiW [Acidaminococcaceae bacterium]
MREKFPRGIIKVTLKEVAAMNIHRLTLAGLLVAIGTLSAHLLYIPAGVAKCFPVQHAINVVAAVALGPSYAVGIAFTISLLRNLVGLGSLLAFPGSMLGAFLAAKLYAHFGSTKAAMLGEIVGTGFLGGLAAFPLSYYLLGKTTVAWFFIPPFLISTLGGSIIAGLLLKSGALQTIAPQLFKKPSKN